MNDSIIEVENLTKKFGNFIAVDHISFTVKRGEVFGLLGPNGAGKSTIIRMLTALTQPTEGLIKIADVDILKNINKVKKQVGLVSEKLIMYDYLTARENLRFFGHLYDLGGKRLEDHINKLLKDVEMWEWRDHKIGTFSTGMKQRINIIRALITDPEIIFMDEPTLGLDPQSTRRVREFIIDLNKQDKTVILTTHVMYEADLLCDRIGIIDYGKIVALDSPGNLKKSINSKKVNQVEIELSVISNDLIKKIRLIPGVNIQEKNNNHLIITFNNEKNLKLIINLVMEFKTDILKLNNFEPSLEDVFITLTGRSLRDETGQKNQSWLRRRFEKRTRIGNF
ncbi:MAG: ATP-binding cassette domain-containing protein [Actinobacteria bacterium]|nr:ATP-binding cassette domain-containing protein [Actinomycetota bacterium]